MSPCPYVIVEFKSGKKILTRLLNNSKVREVVYGDGEPFVAIKESASDVHLFFNMGDNCGYHVIVDRETCTFRCFYKRVNGTTIANDEVVSWVRSNIIDLVLLK